MCRRFSFDPDETWANVTASTLDRATGSDGAAAPPLSPAGVADNVIGPEQHWTLTPWQVLEIVKAELEAQGPVFDKPLAAVLADLGQTAGAEA
jgi:hypothetical protein